MANLEKYKGVIPAFYACYDAEGNVSPERVRALTEYHIRKGVKGVYVNGSSGECIYQSLEDRKITLENVMAVSYTHLPYFSGECGADAFRLPLHIQVHIQSHLCADWNDEYGKGPEFQEDTCQIPQKRDWDSTDELQ